MTDRRRGPPEEVLMDRKRLASRRRAFPTIRSHPSGRAGSSSTGGRSRNCWRASSHREARPAVAISPHAALLVRGDCFGPVGLAM